MGGMNWRWLVGLGLAVMVLSGCAKPPHTVVLTQFNGQQGALQFLIQPDDAKVFVDAVYKGRVRDFQGPKALILPRGLHALEVSKRGYDTFFRQVQISHGLLEIMVLTLQPSKG